MFCCILIYFTHILQGYLISTGTIIPTWAKGPCEIWEASNWNTQRNGDITKTKKTKLCTSRAVWKLGNSSGTAVTHWTVGRQVVRSCPGWVKAGAGIAGSSSRTVTTLGSDQDFLTLVLTHLFHNYWLSRVHVGSLLLFGSTSDNWLQLHWEMFSKNVPKW